MFNPSVGSVGSILSVVGSVTNFSRNGLADWLLQRISSLLILSYIIFLLVYFKIYSFSFVSWVHLQSTWAMKAVNILLALSFAVHAWIGLWTVFTDYINNKTLRLLLQVALALFLLALLFWMLVITLKLGKL